MKSLACETGMFWQKAVETLAFLPPFDSALKGLGRKKENKKRILTPAVEIYKGWGSYGCPKDVLMLV